nr:hypothetical protein [Herbihabitans rhizosphaerae]
MGSNRARRTSACAARPVISASSTNWLAASSSDSAPVCTPIEHVSLATRRSPSLATPAANRESPARKPSSTHSCST